MKVKEIMTADSLQYCSPGTKLLNAAKAMKEANCGALPVLDKENKVIGIITDRDICLALADNQIKPIEKRNVGEVISKNIFSVKTDDEVETALKKMRTNQIGRLPVIDRSGKLKGILSLHNLLSVSLDGQPELGEVMESGESIAKTVKALSDRYSKNGQVQKTRIVTAGRTKTFEEGL